MCRSNEHAMLAAASNKMIFDDEQVAIQLSEAWEHDRGKDELNVVLQVLEQHFWRGTESGWLGCYDFPGETWAGDGSVYKWVMGAGCVCLQRISSNSPHSSNSPGGKRPTLSM